MADQDETQVYESAYGESISESVVRSASRGRQASAVENDVGPSALSVPDFGRWYFVIASALVLVSALIWAVFGLGAASPILLVLALVLLGGWLVL